MVFTLIQKWDTVSNNSYFAPLLSGKTGLYSLGRDLAREDGQAFAWLPTCLGRSEAPAWSPKASGLHVPVSESGLYAISSISTLPSITRGDTRVERAGGAAPKYSA